MDKRFTLLLIRLLASMNLLYAAIFLKFAGVPDAVAHVASVPRVDLSDGIPARVRCV